MIGPIYRDVILEQHVRLFRGAMVAEFLFMEGYARPHRANIVDECLESEDITRMDWPAYSPNLNPVEHVWDMLGRRIAARQPPPTCLPELRRPLLDEWCNIPQDQIDNLILSIRADPRNCNSDSRASYDIPEEVVSKNIYLEFAYKLRPLKGYDLKVSYTRNYPFSKKGLEGALKKCRRWVSHTLRVSARTIRRRLQQSGLSARRPLLGLPLTQNHRRLRHQRCDERRMWAAEWNEIVFTDESRICLQHHDGRIRVWRHRGERMLNSCVMHRHTGPAPVRIADTLNSQRYISEVLEPVVLPYIQGLATAIFQQNNARPHVARIVERFFVNPKIELLSWLARSPDLSPIENMLLND
ncbi:transposable element Tcb1 transposase [Trichonephila clavipes]|nr:transposable element Tcb1 transposase [Trichonephila clavipes]